MSDHNSDIVTPTSANETQSYAQYEAANPVTNGDTSASKKVRVYKMLKAGFKPREIVDALDVSLGYVYKVRDNPPQLEMPKVVADTTAVPSKPVLNLEAVDLPQRKKDFLLAFFDCKGILTNACRVSGLNAQTYYNWLDADPEFAVRIAEIRESVIDFVEECLFKQINNGVVSSTQFYLKTIGKKRGYTERTEITGAGGGAMQVRVIEPYVDPLSDTEEQDDSIEAEYTILEPK